MWTFFVSPKNWNLSKINLPINTFSSFCDSCVFCVLFLWERFHIRALRTFCSEFFQKAVYFWRKKIQLLKNPETFLKKTAIAHYPTPSGVKCYSFSYAEYLRITSAYLYTNAKNSNIIYPRNGLENLNVTMPGDISLPQKRLIYGQWRTIKV